MKKYVITGLFILILAVSAALIYGAEPEVSFSISQREVILGDSVILTITARGISNPETPELPAIPDFSVKFRGVRQDSFSSFQVVINGKNIQKSSSGGGYNFDYELSPKKAGTFNIPSFQINLGGRAYRTESVQIKVLDKSAKSQDIFIKIEADKKDVYLGEKILVTFKWYMNKDINEYRLSIPWLDGLKNFLVTDPELDKSKSYQKLIVNGNQPVAALKEREIYKGQPYAVISFQKILTPIAVGSYAFESSFLKCEVITGYKRSSRRGFFDDFFNSSSDDFFGTGGNAVTEAFATRSEALNITVLEVPSVQKPFGYAGAVGDFDFTVDIKPTSLKAGEPITVTMKVSGSGNIEQLELPDFPEMPDFKSYEPESKVNVSQKGGEVTGEKIFEKVLIPRHKGDFKIPRIAFAFFNPRKGKYQTIDRGPFEVHIAEGEEVSEVKVIAIEHEQGKAEKRELRVITRDIRYIKTGLGRIDKTGKEFYEESAVWLGSFGLPVFVLAGLFIWNKRREKLQTDIGFARSRRAFKNIKMYFKNAEKAAEDQDPRQFYDSISRGLNSYLADKLNRTEAGITCKIVDELTERGLSTASAEKFKSLYSTFEEVLFSSVRPDKEKFEEDYKTVKSLIIDLERILK
ncbi:MAG: BatD family protein [Elusimicrobiota bacterium]